MQLCAFLSATLCTFIVQQTTCEYISEHRNLFITGATGCGKTYMACAFGMEACEQYFNTKYVRLPDLLIEIIIIKSWQIMPIHWF